MDKTMKEWLHEYIDNTITDIEKQIENNKEGLKHAKSSIKNFEDNIDKLVAQKEECESWKHTLEHIVPDD